MRIRKRLFGWFVAIVVVSAPAAVAAEGGVLYDWSSGKVPVFITNDTGVFFVGDNREIRRSYSWDRASGKHKKSVFVTDVDADGEYEVLGAGKPTFLLETNGDPSWKMAEGCGEVIVGNFNNDGRLEFMCNQETAVKLFTYDRQTLWSLDPGIGIDHCRAGDVNGDLQLDLECAFSGRDDWIRIGSDGKILANSTTKQKIEEKPVDLDSPSPVSSEVWNGGTEYDLNGDGTAEESIEASGSAVVIQSRSKKSAVARTDLGSTVRAALVKNLNGEKNPEIIVLTDDEIAVLRNDGEVLGKYSAHAGDYSHHPVAKFKSVFARKFADNGKAKKRIKAKKAEFAKCYEDRVRGSIPPGSGQLIFKAYISGDGELDNIELMHSAIPDEDLQNCARDVLESIDFPDAASADKEEDDAKATVNLVLKFTFASRP